MEKRWTSLCKVNRPDKNQDIWMVRIADIFNGKLKLTNFDEKREKIQDNRQLVYHDEGPDYPDCIGFWEWTERQTDSGKWFSNSTYLNYPTPFEIIIIEKYKKAREIVQDLKTGLRLPPYLFGKVIIAYRRGTVIGGVLCDLSCFNVNRGKELTITIKKNVYSLPFYEIRIDDILSWKYRDNSDKSNPKWINRNVYKYVTLDNPKQLVPILPPENAVAQLFIQRMNWPIFKGNGISKEDWRKVVALLNEIPRGDIADRIIRIYHITPEKAQSYVDSFLQNVESYMNSSDVDTDSITYILENHAGLKRRSSDLAYQKWIADNQASVKKAQAELAAIQLKAADEQKAAEQRICQIEQEINEYKAKRTEIRKEIKTAEKELESLQEKIEHNKKTGDEAVLAIRQKIAEAQNDMAGFIADLSTFMPQGFVPSNQEKVKSCFRYYPAKEASPEDIDISNDWKDECNTVFQNLSAVFGLPNEQCDMLSAFLYAAHINNMPILILGPCGKEIADILSVSIYGMEAGALVFENNGADNALEEISICKEKVLSVSNIFGKEWNDLICQPIYRLNKQIIWTHPYVEDMVIEPKGLYNYMLPIFSECFIESVASVSYFAGKRTENFKSFSSPQNVSTRLPAFDELHLSKLLSNRLGRVLADAKGLLSNSAHKKDLEVLCGLLPLSVLLGRTDTLQNTIDSDNSISNAVKVIANKYIESES